MKAKRSFFSLLHVFVLFSISSTTVCRSENVQINSRYEGEGDNSNLQNSVESIRAYELGQKLAKENKYEEAGLKYLEAVKAGYQPVSIPYQKYLQAFQAAGKLNLAFVIVG